jgi:hypothetical protein
MSGFFDFSSGSVVEVSVSPSDSQFRLIKDGWFSETEAMWPGFLPI